MRHNEVKMCRVLLGYMVVPTSYCKRKEIPPWHSIPKLDQFLQVVVAMNVLTKAHYAIKWHWGENWVLKNIILYLVFVGFDNEMYSTYNSGISRVCRPLKKVMTKSLTTILVQLNNFEFPSSFFKGMNDTMLCVWEYR